jgi:phage pi2 protein 07
MNKLEAMGYLNKEKTGYVLKDISRSKYKIKGMPKLKKIFVNVGTIIQDGIIVTDLSSKVEIKHGKISVLRAGKLRRWEFSFNAAQEFSKNNFRKHIKKNMKQEKLKKGQYVVAGAGMYEIASSATDDLNDLADTIHKMREQYAIEHALGERKADPSDWMGRVIVYEGKNELKNAIISKNRIKSLRRKKGKHSRIKGR